MYLEVFKPVDFLVLHEASACSGFVLLWFVDEWVLLCCGSNHNCCCH